MQRFRKPDITLQTKDGLSSVAKALDDAGISVSLNFHTSTGKLEISEVGDRRAVVLSVLQDLSSCSDIRLCE